MTTTEPTRTYKLSLHEAFTTTYDRYLHAPFKGNHRDFMHYRERKGDSVTEVTIWGRDTAGHWVNRDESTHSIARLIEDLSDCAIIEVIDDLPEGISYSSI